MPTVYNESSLKALVLKQINKISDLKTPFDNTDSQEAYDEAVRECGFSCPPNTDTDKERKYQWLVQRMRRWFLWQLLAQNPFRFDAGDMKAQQIVKNLQMIVDKLDTAFETAKSEMAELFVDISYFGTDLVLGTGLIEDRMGESTEERI